MDTQLDLETWQNEFRKLFSEHCIQELGYYDDSIISNLIQENLDWFNDRFVYSWSEFTPSEAVMECLYGTEDEETED